VEEHGVRRGEVDVADAAHLVHGREEPCGGTGRARVRCSTDCARGRGGD
jgi:hypothetical protein